MAWIYLAESEECQSPYKNGSDQLPTAKSTPIVKEFSLAGCIQESLQSPLSIMTFVPFLPLVLQAQLMLSMVVFHVRTLALQDLEKAWKESEADFFSRSCAWPKKSSPRSYSLKTFPQSPHEEALGSLEKLPKWGMIVDGALYPLRPLERYTVAKDGSYWLTPTTMDNLPVRQGKTLDYVMRRGGTSYRKTTGRLSEQVAYPQMWPTPTSNARGARTNQNGHHFTIQDAVGSGKLNPTWVEWLMGYPKGHTELEPWAMQWFLSKQKKRSKS